jgi:hypothetical protein
VFPRTELNERDAEEENRRMMHAHRVSIGNLAGSGLPFDADDIRDAVTIAAASTVTQTARDGYIAGVPRRNAQTSRYVLVGNQAHLRQYVSENGRRKVGAFVEKLNQSQMFFFKDGMVRTRSGLLATVTYNEQLGKICVYLDGTDLQDPHRRQQTMDADAKIILGNLPQMFPEAAILLDCAASTFGPTSVFICGHSLGGSMCQFASAHIGVPGISINSAPINENWLLKLSNDKLKFAQNNGCHVSVQGDPLSTVSSSALAGNVGCVQLFNKTLTVPHSGTGNPHLMSTVKEAAEAFFRPNARG